MNIWCRNQVSCALNVNVYFSTTCGMAKVQQIFGPGPVQGSNHIKLQTAGGPDSMFQRVILMKRIYYETNRFTLKKSDKMHFRVSNFS